MYAISLNGIQTTVNKLNEIISSQQHCIKELQLSYFIENSINQTLQTLFQNKCLNEIQILSLHNTSIEDSFLLWLSHSSFITILKQLDLSFCMRLTSQGLIDFFSVSKDMQNLQLLNLQQTRIIDKTLEKMTQLPNLTYLDISVCKFYTNSGFISLVKSNVFNKLESLEMMQSNISDISLIELADLPNQVRLKQLNISACQNLTSYAISYLLESDKCEKLEKLNLSLNRIENFVLQSLTERKFSYIKQLMIHDCETLTNQGLMKLVQSKNFIQNMEIMDVSNCYCKDEFLQELGQTFTQIQKLKIQGCSDFSDSTIRNFLQNIEQLQKLRILIVSNCDVSFDTLKLAVQLTGEKKLHLKEIQAFLNQQITLQQIQQLKEMAKQYDIEFLA